MKKMLNRSILQGRLCADPELKQTASGTSVCSFRIAVERNFADKDGNRQADFIDIVAWKGTAEFICKYFSKGNMILLEGSIQTRSYEDKNGNKRTAVEVVADQVYFCESKRREAETAAQDAESSYSQGQQADFQEIDGDSSDLPF